MKYDHDAIIKAYDGIWGSIEDDLGVFDKDGNVLEIDQAKVDAARVELDKLNYQNDRKYLYPPLEDLADALYWNSKGDSSKLTEYYAACEKVKTDHPKPS